MKQLFVLVLSGLMLVSCTKVIKVDLNTANPQYVMEAVLFAGTHDFTVSVTKTTSYFNPKAPERVENAVIHLTDGNQLKHSLQPVAPGVYQLKSFQAQVGKEYTLVVNAGGKTYEARAVVPEPVPVQRIEYKDEELNLYYQDPQGVKNYYRINGAYNTSQFADNTAQISDDFGQDGKLISESPPIGGEEEDFEFQSGDSLFVEFRTIDAKSFQYLNTLENTGGEGDGPPGGGTTPANPVSNWSNNGLGYFGAASREVVKTIVP